jgi:hypothetical protein
MTDTRLPQTPQEQLLWEVCDLVSLWKNGVIKGLPRADRNAAIEATRARIIALVEAGAAVPPVSGDTHYAMLGDAIQDPPERPFPTPTKES